MSKERELLARVLIGDDDGDFFLSHSLYKEIEELLAQPEPKQKPLSDDKLNEMADKYITDEACAGYFNGFRDAEKAHGIGD